MERNQFGFVLRDLSDATIFDLQDDTPPKKQIQKSSKSTKHLKTIFFQNDLVSIVTSCLW